MPDILIDPIVSPFDVVFTPPGSKSITNRALVMAALCDGPCRLENVLFADDTQVMLESLRVLDFKLTTDEVSKAVTVFGRSSKIDSPGAELFCGNSGTTIRFLAALCALGKGRFVLDGIERMRHRPIGPLVEMLRNLGVRVNHLGQEGFVPIEVNADGLAGGNVRFDASSSSQFLSAVLMAAPLARNEVHVHLGPDQTSWPYVQMTLQMMHDFTQAPELERDPLTGEPKRIVVPRGKYSCDRFLIEPDASNASYFLAIAAAHPGCSLTLKGLGTASLQGDARFGRVLKRAGVHVEESKDQIKVTGPQSLGGFDADLSDMPDLAQTTAVLALLSTEPSELRGLHTLRVKETDRVAALQAELGKLGARVEVEKDTLRITPPTTISPAAIDTYDDHRMAMSFAVLGTRVPGITIKDAQCVNKTYPGFFDDLRALVR